MKKHLGRLLLIIAVLVGGAPLATAQDDYAKPQQAAQQTVFRVKYVSEGSIYLDAGKNAGLEEGMILRLCHGDPDGGTTDSVRFQGVEPLAEVRIFSVADSSAAAEIVKSREDVAVGDFAYLDVQSVKAREDKVNSEESEKYPVVVTFSFGDPLDEELRATNVEAKTIAKAGTQIRGRIGVDFGFLSENGGASSRQTGLLIDADISSIGGTHWNFKGYWRGDFESQNSGSVGGINPLVLNALLNHTYTLGLYYENPDAVVTAGVGRLYLPWAPSLSAIDGGYFGYRFNQKLTVGVFGGSTPDPTSWSYAPNQHIAGVFVNRVSGDFERWRFSNTFGMAATSIGWHIGREFAFAENTISYGRIFSVYNSLQVDAGRTALTGTTSSGIPFVAAYKTGLTQSFSSIRVQPISLLSFNLNDNYLRNLPTFDPALIGTGLEDQYLFSGLSGGVTVNLPYRITLSTDIGKSNSSSSTSTTNNDKSPSWNQMYGLTLGEIKKTGLQVDLRYTKFDSAFGKGQYEFVSLSRTIADRFHVQLQGGTQHLASIAAALSASGTASLLTSNTNSTFITSIVDMSLGSHFFVEGLYSYNIGTSMKYSQTNFTFGYRFGGSLRK